MIDLLIGLIPLISIQTGTDCKDMKEGVYAYYNNKTDIVYMCGKPSAGIQKSFYLFHEVGHRYWYKTMNDAQRAAYTELYASSHDMTSDYVRDFGATSVLEDFADSFAANALLEWKGTIFKDTPMVKKKLAFIDTLVDP